MKKFVPFRHTFDWQEYANTPQEFLSLLDSAKITPIRDPEHPEIVAHIAISKPHADSKRKLAANNIENKGLDA